MSRDELIAPRTCATCDSEQNLQNGHGRGGLNDVCYGCFYIWYDGDIPRGDSIKGEDIRAYALRAKVDGTWPFNVAHEAERERAAASLRAKATISISETVPSAKAGAAEAGTRL